MEVALEPWRWPLGFVPRTILSAPQRRGRTGEIGPRKGKTEENRGPPGPPPRGSRKIGFGEPQGPPEPFLRHFEKKQKGQANTHTTVQSSTRAETIRRRSSMSPSPTFTSHFNRSKQDEEKSTSAVLPFLRNTANHDPQRYAARTLRSSLLLVLLA